MHETRETLAVTMKPFMTNIDKCDKCQYYTTLTYTEKRCQNEKCQCNRCQWVAIVKSILLWLMTKWKCQMSKVIFFKWQCEYYTLTYYSEKRCQIDFAVSYDKVKMSNTKVIFFN